MGKLGRAHLVGAIQEVSIRNVKSEILLNIWVFILGKHLKIKQKKKNTNHSSQNKSTNPQSLYWVN